MKRILIFLVILMSATSALSVEKNEEFRATWVITWELIDSVASAEENMANIRTILDNHKRANMNAVLWQARQNGTAYYRSSYEPWGKYASHRDPGFDPLGYAVEEAHARGLEIHAWFNVFEARDRIAGSPSHEHPEWICRDQSGIPMTSSISISPGLAEVRDYLVKVAMEIVRNYDIDGLHLDYVRWNEFSNSAESKALARAVDDLDLPSGFIMTEQLQDMQENASGRYLYDYLHPYSAGVPEGFDSWEDWWRWSVTDFVKALHDSIQAVKPWVRLSPAVLGNYNWDYWQGYGEVFQDPALWFNEGYIEQLMPMHYHWLTGAEFYSVLTGGCPKCWRQWIQDGIDDGRLYTVGPPSYKLDEDNLWYRHPDIIEKSRAVSFVDGFQFFSYGDWADRKYWDEASVVLFPSRAKIRAMKIIDSDAPASPVLTLSMIDSLNVEINVQPPQSSTESFWTAIYRSPDANMERDRDDIVEFCFGNQLHTFIDSFSGNQDYNQTYYYFATSLDRYWNESEPSNGIESEPIHSAPPYVISTVPLSGDTIAVNQSVTILFSKSMEMTAVENAIAFTPTVEIAQYLWTDAKSLILDIEDNFEYDTEYIMTIQDLAQDINGVNLDGNGDGVAGEDFVLTFRTLAFDDQGPVVIQSYPPISGGMEDFAIDDIMTLTFDEYLDVSSIHDTTIMLMYNTEEVETNFAITDMKERSILYAQPIEALSSDSYYSLLVNSTITDTIGNVVTEAIQIDFKTEAQEYAEIKIIDSFLSNSSWERPDYSGSTVGIIKQNTEFIMTSEAYLPKVSARQRIAATLRYEWDESAAEFLIREYLASGAPREVVFDTSYVLQSYVFGDGSHNLFRFCIDEDDGTNTWAVHEVSDWIKIDWYGWRLMSWDLGDTEQTGDWIGNSALDGIRYRMDSYQLGHEVGAELSGTVYFDDLRVVKKADKFIGVDDEDQQIAREYLLHQNYPNPFNPTTTIPFEIARSGFARLTVYNLLGQRVSTLIEKPLIAGYYEVNFDARDLSSGLYFYILESSGMVLKRHMVLLK
ncbi:family 10 glycosylhydrolase [candidate division KSB1 bacterium]|nr:family 10 glycosylhydrolase [candidate division KSB1 bacterium]